MSSTEPKPAESNKPHRPLRKRLFVWAKRLLILGLALLLCAMLFTRWVAGKQSAPGLVESVGDVDTSLTKDELVVMSVNCAHGRGEGWHQLLTANETLKANCESIGRLLAEHGADVVCMQECDAPSWWSGGFDHAKTIAEAAKLPRMVQALNVDGAGLHYGTAMLSRFEIEDSMIYTFRPTPPTFSKGVTIAQMQWPGDDTFVFDVVAVHLDFASGSARGRQVDELVSVLRKRGRPIILAGDLNSDWDTDGAAQQLASALQLTAFEPDSEMVTFPFTGERLDWVLVSKDFEITAVEAIDAKLSDHRPLRAVVRRHDRTPAEG